MNEEFIIGLRKLVQNYQVDLLLGLPDVLVVTLMAGILECHTNFRDDPVKFATTLAALHANVGEATAMVQLLQGNYKKKEETE